MSKEMIISVNGREKKIAIVENGQTTEFYIERGEENSGVVGNIYKGRVQRVLPGMQSAFVDIGLERDAFLYVSDFFDEEEEIERIVMEKAKKSSKEEAEREATDEIYKKRLKREKQMEDVQNVAEPIAEEEKKKKGRSSKKEDEEEDEKDDQTKSKRGRRGRGRKSQKEETEDKKKKDDQREEDKKDDKSKGDKSNDDKSKDDKSSGKNRGRKKTKTEDQKQDEQDNGDDEDDQKDVDLPDRGVEAPEIVFDDSGFERIIDDEDTGDMFKDAYMQEAIVDQVRAIEFDMESTSSTEVGSLIDSVDDSNGFERIADEDEEEDEKPKSKAKSRSSRSRKTASKSKTKKKGNEEESDSEETSAEETEEKPKRKRTTRKRKTTSRKKTTKKADEENGEDEKANEAEDKKKTSRSKRKTSSRRSTKKSDEKENKDEQLKDAEASVKEEDPNAEMAARRGGRGRKRSSSSSSKSEDKPSGRSGGRRNYKSSNRRQSSQPTITDLLQEGQEILVQIAKEPIAKKGARITSHIALPGRFIVYMPTIEHLGVSRKIESSKERTRLRSLIQKIKDEVDLPSGGFIVRTAGIGISEDDLRQDAQYLVNTWHDIKKDAEKAKSPELVHQDLDIVQRLLRDHLSNDYAAIRVDSEEEYLRTIEFVNRIQPKLVKRVKFYTRDEPILEKFGVQEEINKALKPRVWLKSGGYLVINQTEALIAIDVNTGKFVGKGNARLEDTITKTNMEAVGEIARQIRLRDLGGIIVLDLIDMEDRRNRHKVLQTLQDELATDKSPTKVLSFNDFGLIIMTRKRVKQSLERTLCSPCEYCQSAGWVKSAQTVCYEILEESRRLAKNLDDVRQTTLRVHPEVAEALRTAESEVLDEIEDYLGNVDVTGDATIHQEQFDFAFI